MLSKGDCRFIGSIVSLEDGTARVQKVHEDKIIVMNMCGRGDKDIFTIADELNIKI